MENFFEKVRHNCRELLKCVELPAAPKKAKVSTVKQVRHCGSMNNNWSRENIVFPCSSGFIPGYSPSFFQQATADAIKLLNDANASDAVVKLKALEAFAQAADGQATKIIIPSEIQGLAGLVEGVTETIKK